MILYHGSFVIVEKPNLLHSRINVDFGKAFYVTPIYEQAANWCKKFLEQGRSGFVSSYEFSELHLSKLKVLKFDSYSEVWLDFVLNCRTEKDTSDYDLVIGGIANDKVFNTIEFYLDGLLDKGEALRRLKYEKPNLQMAFRTEVSLSLLKFIKGEKL